MAEYKRQLEIHSRNALPTLRIVFFMDIRNIGIRNEGGQQPCITVVSTLQCKLLVR